MSAPAAATRPGPHVLVLFGATGDLAARKLFPGFYHLWVAGLMPEEFRIIGSGRHSPGTDDEFREQVRAALDEHGRHEVTDEGWEEFAAKVSFTASSADDAKDLAAAVEQAESDRSAGEEDVHRLIYLSVPPAAMQDMVQMLGDSGLSERARLVLEKPFGTDLETAKELDATLHAIVGEDQVFRIDHFLGKEAAQNILALRFANGLFEPVWNRQHIEYVQIDVPEKLGLEGRASFYEATGAFRDMIVTHLFQLLGFVALEPPVRLQDRSLHDEKAKLFEAVRPLDPEEGVFGQFEGYREEDDVAEDSTTETFAAVKVHVDTWQIARAIGMSTGGVTPAVDRMERRGLVERRPNPADRRSSVLALTEEGARMMGSGMRILREALDPLEQQMSEEEIALVVGVLEAAMAGYEAVSEQLTSPDGEVVEWRRPEPDPA